MNILYIESHPDDFILSNGGLFEINKHKITICNIFSKSIFENDIVKSINKVNEITKNRKNEEKSILGLKNVPIYFFDFPDSSVRGDDFFRSSVDERLFQEIINQISTKLKDMEQNNYDVILCPAALGNHIDHIIVREASVKAFGKEKEIMLYEDLAYAENYNENQIRSHCFKLGFENESIITYSDDILCKKMNYIDLYKTQNLTKEKEMILNYNIRLKKIYGEYCERIWKK